MWQLIHVIQVGQIQIKTSCKQGLDQFRTVTRGNPALMETIEKNSLEPSQNFEVASQTPGSDRSGQEIVPRLNTT